nr:hypothetical protein GCM10020092_028890 [Actinoplanes digitatis]
MPGRGERAEYDHGRGRYQPQCPPGMEPAQRQPPVLPQPAQHDAGDEEAGDHEEDVDAGLAVDEAEAGVVADHQQDRDGTQPRDVAAERRRRRRGVRRGGLGDGLPRGQGIGPADRGVRHDAACGA